MGMGHPNREMKRIKDHLVAIKILRENGLNGAGIIGAYHQRRLAPLIGHTLPLHQMIPNAPPKGTVLTEDLVVFFEITHCIKDTMDSQEGPASTTHDYLFPVPGCPPMRPEPSFIKFVSSLSPLNSLFMCFWLP
jgi:hypothetical protein